ncbi:MAG: ATP-binding protein, partial [Bacteroidales bacterium]|nr:ATP-binding protein [Bacteroidales bacterium]
MQKLYEMSKQLVELTELEYIRPQISFFEQNERLIGIKGSRGVGKTTLLLQFAKTRLKNRNYVYLSLDNTYFTENKLVDFVDDFVKNGGEYLLLDEVHHYTNWSIELKNIYDNYKGLTVLYTGSSLLHLTKGRADLSRRTVMDTLLGFSFREYVNITEGFDFEALSLVDIVGNHVEIATKLFARIKPIVKYKEYLKYGYYPFFLHNKESYPFKLAEITNQILEADLPQFAKINYSNVKKLKQVLYAISESVPFKPNITKLSAQIAISKNTLMDYMHYLKEALLIDFLYSEKSGFSKISKPEKIYLYHPNLMFSITNNNTNIGNMRESFFLNQVSANNVVNYTKKGDFIVNNKYI